MPKVSINIVAAHQYIEPGGALMMALQHGNELAKQGHLAKFFLITSQMYDAVTGPIKTKKWHNQRSKPTEIRIVLHS